MSGERARWDRLAQDPYYAVINDPRNRTASLTADARRMFFESGERDVATTIGLVRQLVDPAFSPRYTVDYGCGVGRLAIPLARYSEREVGVDISATMLEEGRRNCAERGIRNVEFQLADEYLVSPSHDSPDFVHSFIVFQHIPPRIGESVFLQLVRRLVPGGVGALHVTHARRASVFRRTVNWTRRRFPPANMLVNAVQGRGLLEPLIPMYRYDIGKLLSHLGDRGCRTVHVLPTDHGGYQGAMLIFRVP